MVKHYPRGNKELLQVFSRFSTSNTVNWFKQHGVQLKTEDDGRMFPASNNSETIVNCFTSLAKQLKIDIKTHCEVFAITKREQFSLKTSVGVILADSVICALGGHHKAGAYDVIRNLGHNIVTPIPSLFTLNLPEETIKKDLQGVAVANAGLCISGSKTNYSGPVLITHWGLSGPAVLKLSAYAAREFFELNYESAIIVNWAFPLKLLDIEEQIFTLQKQKARALPYSNPTFNLPKRLWEFLCMQADIDNTKTWAELSRKQVLKLAETVYRSKYTMKGKTTFKEEFVTCGGVNLKEVDFKTMQSKVVEGMFFCGEVLNIDGVTGGYNFQSAWSTAWICAESV